MNVTLALAIGIGLLLANAGFVAAEFGLIASRRSRVEQLAAEGARGARQAAAGHRELSLMLAGAQLGITMCSIGLGVVAEPALARVIEDGTQSLGLDLPSALRHALAVAIALSIVVFLHMVVGEMAPKSWAIAHPERAALRLALVFRGFVVLLRPVIRAMNATANGVVRVLGVAPREELATAHAPADLVLLLEESAAGGDLLPEDHHLLTRSIELSGRDAETVMVPRHDIVSVDGAASAGEIEAVAVATGRSRIVVSDRDLEHAVGVVHVRSLLTRRAGDGPEPTARELARPILVVPASRALEDLFLDMQQSRRLLALVVDDHGVVLGLVTMEDLLEELVGEISDESDPPGAGVARQDDGAWILPGRLRPDEVRALTGLELPDGEWETLGGLVMAVLGRVPDPGDVAEVGDLAIDVRTLDGFAVDEVRIRPRTPRPGAQ